MMDVTEFKTIFGAKTVHLAASFDAFSRLPLTAMALERKPGGAAMARLFRKATGLFQAPTYLVTCLVSDSHCLSTTPGSNSHLRGTPQQLKLWAMILPRSSCSKKRQVSFVGA